ncbi:MAG: efflux RND transporter periplasmic adaptor subunit [Bacteroidetes bacterium]|nr:efflux RND transporter periplasmic adaptor subunit [Bacteroidota bacterium]
MISEAAIKKIRTGLLSVFLMGIGLTTSCTNPESQNEANVVYTCSMDPQVREYKPGNCPICKMPLTPVATDKTTAPNELKLSDQQILLGNISTDTVREQVLGNELILTGALVENQDQVTTISSRVSGRIDNLYVKTPGQKVAVGQTLYTIYSEELLLALNELKLALEKKKNLPPGIVDSDRIIRSSKNKLMLFGLTGDQITALTTAKDLPDRIPVYSQVTGVVSVINVTEGSYVSTGTELMSLSDYSTLWAQAEIFSEDMLRIKQGMPVVVSIPALNNLELKGTISLINPSLDQNTKLGLVRVLIENKEHLLKPGLQANFSIVYDSYAAIAIPTNAIIFDEDGATVWVQSGPNSFQSKMVEPGAESNGFTEIKKGISVGETVVITGAYLLNSEFIFQKGTGVMSGHDMEHM